MTSKFTLRDFLVYFTTGALFLVSINLIYFTDLLQISTKFFSNYELIDNIGGLLILFAIPLIYLIGHILHSFGIISLWIYKQIHINLGKFGLRKYKLFECLRVVLHFFMYKIKVIEAVLQENKKNATWHDKDEFWQVCAKLQNENKFSPAEYWYTLNDLFKGLYTAFLFSSILSILEKNYILLLIFVLLMLISHARAVYFGENFVITVKRLQK